MLRRFGRKVMNNFGLKLLSLGMAIGLWMVVVNIDDPTVRKSMTLSVVMKNQEYITDMGKYMDILGDSNTITFYYTTKRSVWENISNADFTAVADLEKIEAKSNGGYRVPVTVTAIRNTNQITIETKQIYLDISLEDLGRKQFQIRADTSGTVAEGCALGNIIIGSANVVQVSGPISVVSSIDSVTATINVDGMATDITDNVVPVFYDANGEVVDTTKLEKSVDTVRVSAQILNTKEVPLSLSTMGKPAEGYQLTSVSCNPTSVLVKGTLAILNTLDKIGIPAQVLDLTGAVSTIEKTIDISTYLGSVSLVDNADAKVEIVAEIEPVETREYQVPISNLAAIGLKSGYQIAYTERYVLANVTAVKSVLDQLNTSEIKGIIHVENLGEGAHAVPVVIELDEAVYKVGDIITEIEITYEQPDTESGDGDTDADGSNSETTESETIESETTENETPEDTGASTEETPDDSE